MKRHFFAASLVLALSLLAACNGSGGTFDGAPVVQGRAVKGVLQHAMVSVYRHDDGQWRRSGTSYTDAEGRFDLPRLPAGRVKIVIEPAPDGRSRMICDAGIGCGPSAGNAGDLDHNGIFDFGESMPLPSGFGLSAMLPAERGEGYATLAVTPFTHLAAVFAERMPDGLTDRGIRLAEKRVSELFGLGTDHGRRIPVDPADPSALSVATDLQVHEAMLLAAFAELDGTGSLDEVLEHYASTLSLLGGTLPEAELEVLAQAAIHVADTAIADPSVRTRVTEDLRWVARGLAPVPAQSERLAGANGAGWPLVLARGPR